MQVYRIDEPNEVEIIKEEIDSQLPVEKDLEESKTLEEFIYEYDSNK